MKAAVTWLATISVLDHGRYWRQHPPFTVKGGSVQVAARNALTAFRRGLGKGARLEEVLLRLKRLPTLKDEP